MFAFREAHRARDSKKQIDQRDESGTRVVATRRSLRAAVNESQLRSQLSRDLDILMNTVNFASVIPLDEHENVRVSIVNFGIPDIVNRTIDEARVDLIVDEIHTAVLDFEPRLIRQTVKVVRDMSVDPDTLNIRYLVSGEMSCDPVAVPVEFVADLEVTSGKLSVSQR
jgi:type VI secretion system protein ImpF